MRRKREAGKAEEPGALTLSGFSMLPWLLIGLGAFSNLFRPETPNPVIGGLGLLAFNSLYIYVVFRAFLQETRESRRTRVALALLTLITCALALGYGGAWLLFFPLLGLATGAAVRMPHLRWVGLVLTALAAAIGALRQGWDSLDTTYATWISMLVTAAVLSLADTVRELRSAREELARRAVERERLRFSRDLHDLLGHTLSVIVVKSEAARRLAPRNLDAALAQITDIESVGRQALTEIREAVTGYRESTLTAELDRARSTLTTAGITPTVTESGPPLSPQTAALLAWVVRESVTNIVRHSKATHCTVTLTGTLERVRLTVTDDGPPARPTGQGPAPLARATETDADLDGDATATDSATDSATDADAASQDPSTPATGAHSTGTPDAGIPGTTAPKPDAPTTDTAKDTATGTGTGTEAPDTATPASTPEPSTTLPPTAPPLTPPTRGTGLIGLRERLAAAGGTLEAGPGARGGFTVTAELPTEAEDYSGSGPGRRDPVHGAGSLDGWHPEACAPGVYTVRPAEEPCHTAPSAGPDPRLSP
ncbi:sensor histidine kinase [Streptomyces roseirectus]|uniref:Sensor histidine kinase n=1 Tax=Streptomyces roseirectus TaxID=2768066 RepID=A0A7H0IJN7_9ACTN|nr:histidine kinase [Streptomyces roseirectus]QNP73003.1 sensor histidine kinase [Streptomyces roseirectus]